MQEIKNFLNITELEHLNNKYIKQGLWKFGQVSDSKLDHKYPMWFIDLWDIKKQTLIYNDYVLESIFLKLKDVCKIKKIVRFMISGNTYGQDGDIHCDWNTKEHQTGIAYLNVSWDTNYGGETILYKRDPWLEHLHTCNPKPGKALIFDSWLPHIGKAPHRHCGELRTVLVIQGDVNG